MDQSHYHINGKILICFSNSIGRFSLNVRFDQIAIKSSNQTFASPNMQSTLPSIITAPLSFGPHILRVFKIHLNSTSECLFPGCQYYVSLHFKCLINAL